MEEVSGDSIAVNPEEKDAASLKDVKAEVEEDLTKEYEDAIGEIDETQSV
jgi:hypothetical protein